MAETLLETQSTSGSLAQQVLVEHQILKHVTAALRVALAWQAPEVAGEKKLSTVRFAAQSFQRHLDRLFGLEESGGYLEFVCDRFPGLFEKVARLRNEHTELRHALGELMSDLSAALGEPGPCDSLYHRLGLLLDRLEVHHTREVQLTLSAQADLGGEG
jgi:hypothetical protein